MLDSPEEGDQLQAGEILVAVTTNVGWTPLFPRAAAVVGCVDATTRLRTGDWVLVDSGQGVVEILEAAA